MKLATSLLVFSVAALLALGMVMLYSSSMAQHGARYLVMQLVWGALGLVVCVVAASQDYRHLGRVSLLMYAVAVVMLALVLHPEIGYWVNGARRWFNFKGIRFQPSEFGKLALVVALAWYGARYQRQMSSWVRGVAIPGVMVMLVLVLIFKEPDFGTTILLAVVSASMLLVAGVRWKHIIPPVVAGAVALGVAIWHDPVRIKRVFSWLNLEENKMGVGWQAYQAMLALGSGGWTGLGLGNSRRKFGFVPEHHTDFIFSIIGEELGLVATLLVVVAFVVVVACGIYIAMNARDTFGMLLGTGITFLIGMQAFINIGVVTSALPNKGLPLPFISYGGSNLLMMLTFVGILLSIARHARLKPALAEEDEPEELSSPQLT